MLTNFKKYNYYLIFIFLILFVAGCAPKTFSKSEKVLYTTNQILQNAKNFRILALKSAAECYKQGLLSENKKQKIIKLGDQLQASINITAQSLILYKQLGCTDSTELEKNMQEFNKVFNEFTDLMLPLMYSNHK